MYNPFSLSAHSFIYVISIAIALWVIPWKVYAVWTAVKNEQRGWFVALLLLNTLSILELYFIFKVAKKSWREVKEDFRNRWESLWKKE